MLSRLFLRPSNLRLIALVSTKSQPQVFSSFLRPLSTGGGGGGDGNGNNDSWRFSRESEGQFDSFFGEDSGKLSGVLGSESVAGEDDSWLKAKDEEEGDLFKGIEKEEIGAKNEDGWLSAEQNKPWSLNEEVKDDLFDIGEEVVREVGRGWENTEAEKVREKEIIEREEKELSAIIKGPDRAFGDLIAASGITDEMLDSLIALKDFQGVEGLPPLTEIEDLRYEKSLKKSSRADLELQKQEEIAKSRVRQVDEKGRAYGTGRRKCSIARVWIQPGDGKFVVNDKDFDVYFPVLDHRAALLRPFAETKSLGLWNVNCTVKGGGVSGQVGAIRLGISRALQNWEPDLRPPLRSAGFLTRDSRVVERKKPGKAKARKSFQWVKR